MASNISMATSGGWSAPGQVNHETPPLLTRQFGLGGIKRRYALDRGRLIRFVDPFTGELHWYSDPLQYENWLLRRFDPSIATLDPRRLAWTALHHGKLMTVQPCLHWSETGVPGCLELVIKADRQPRPRLLDSLDIVARAHGMKASARMSAQIRADGALLDLLDIARQRLVVHAHAVRDKTLCGRVVEAISQASTIPELFAHMRSVRASTTRDELLALLFWLRQLRRIAFTVEGGGYDASTVIQLL